MNRAGNAVTPHHRRKFWLAQGLGWFLFGIVYFLSVLPLSPFPPWRLFGFKMIWAISGLLVSSGMAAWYRYVGVAHRELSVALVTLLASCAAVAIGWVLLLGNAATALHGSSHMIYDSESFPFVVSNHFFILLAWSGGYLALAYWTRAQQQEKRSLEATHTARQAQLEMLRYQINPHFLFNSLTSIRALISEAPDRAREMLTLLADFLRYSLSRTHDESVTVTEEMAIVSDYLAIEKVRFEERLDCRVVVDPQAAHERIPPFLVHTLVENAIKHGKPADGRLTIQAEAHITEGRLVITVSNSGSLAIADDGPGQSASSVGLNNLRHRLRVIPGRHQFDLRQSGETVVATIAMDLEATT